METSMTASLIARKLSSIAMLVTLVGCTSTSSTFHFPHELGGGKTLLTSADLRAMNTTPVTVDPSRPGRIVPSQVTCLEPSPDLAKVVSANSSVGTSLSFAQPGAGPSVDTALSVAKARAESAAQMTDRLAVIQLLRDALYRACEAYANGALTSTSYAVVLGRYDDIMVTMLLGELAAGNFGGSLAKLGGSASGTATATLTKKAIKDEEGAENAKKKKETAEKQVSVQQKKFDNKQKERDTAKDDADAAQKKLDDAPADGDKTALAKDRDEKNKKVADLEEQLDTERDALVRLKEQQRLADQALATALTSATASRALANASAATGAVGAKDNQNVAQQLADMQKLYMENINADALIVACVTALDNPQAGATWLARICNDTVIPTILTNQGKILGILKSRAVNESMVRNIGEQKKRLADVEKAIK
jgi:hypothetical protein